DAWIRPRRVDERDDGNAEFFGELHQTQGFAVTFRVGATKVAHDIFLGVAAFLVSDDDASMGTEHGQSARHRSIVRKMAVAVQFGPAGEATLDVIEGERALHVPRDLDPLPGTEIP